MSQKQWDRRGDRKPAFDFTFSLKATTALVDLIDAAAEVEGASSRVEYMRQALSRDARRVLRVHQLRLEWEKKEAQKE